MNRVLTIAIPTYNRYENLLENFPSVLDQLTEECELLIIDNASNEKMPIGLLDLMNSNQSNEKKITYVKNDNNVGLFANILRCFELTKTKWLYILGDDDMIESGAIEQILFDIRNNQDVLNIHYKWLPELNWSTKRKKLVLGLKDFINSIESIHHVLYLASNVYNREKLIEFLSIAHYYQLTSAPHLVLLLLGLNKNNLAQVFLSDSIIVNNKNEYVDEKTRWNKTDFYRNNKLILDLPLKYKNDLYNLFNKSYPLKVFFKYFLLLVEDASFDRVLEFKKSTYYIQIYGNMYNKFLRQLFILLLKNSRLSKAVLKIFRVIE